MLRDRRIWFTAIAGTLALLPLIVLLTLKFGQQNIRSVAGIQDAQVSRASLAGWLWYARQMPSQIGPVALLGSVLGLGALLINRERTRGFLLPLMWLVSGYIFFSAIDLKESRHTVFLLLPLSILAVFGVITLFRRRPRIATSVALAIGAATLALTIAFRPVEYVSGYDDVAKYVAGIAPKDGIVASRYRDGAFIFAMRTHGKSGEIFPSFAPTSFC